MRRGGRRRKRRGQAAPPPTGLTVAGEVGTSRGSPTTVAQPVTQRLERCSVVTITRRIQSADADQRDNARDLQLAWVWR